jgi:uncharacterized short protein YbdD (DUF466 family)
VTLVRKVLGTIRRLAGMPDYEAYVAHLRAHHPGHPVPDRRTFFDEWLRARAAGGATRCC